MNKALVIIICFWSSLAIGQDWEVHTTALPANSTVIDFKVVSENEIYAIGEPFKFAKWDGSTWFVIEGLENLSVSFLSVFDSDNAFIITEETVGSFINYHYKKWNGTSLASLPSPNYYFNSVYPKSIQADSPTSFFISNHINSQYDGPRYITRWDGTQWLYSYANGGSTHLLLYALDPTFIYLGSKTTSPASNGPYWIKVMNYSAQSTISLNFSNKSFYNPKCMTWLNPYEFYISEVYPSYPSDDDFSSNHHVWKWNSNEWVQLTDIDDELPLNKNLINSMYVHNQNELYVGGKIRSSVTDKYLIGKWNGTNWSELGILDSNSEPQIDQKDGYLYAMGKFTVGTDSNAALIKRIDIGSNLGVSEPYQENGFQFYPNPAQDQISFNKTIDKVSLITVEGKIIKVAKIANQMRIDDISKGVYFLKFEQKDSVATIKKLIKN